MFLFGAYFIPFGPSFRQIRIFNWGYPVILSNHGLHLCKKIKKSNEQILPKNKWVISGHFQADISRYNKTFWKTRIFDKYQHTEL